MRIPGIWDAEVLRTRGGAAGWPLALLALGACPPASAQSYEQALAGFAADSFSDTDAAIAGVAGSGHPLAAKVIGALQDGRLLFNPDDKKIYVREASGQRSSMPPPASPSPARRRPVSRPCASTTACAAPSRRRWAA